MGVAVVIGGYLLAVVGLFLLFGPFALVVTGLIAVACGLLVDWEALTHEPARTPSD